LVKAQYQQWRGLRVWLQIWWAEIVECLSLLIMKALTLLSFIDMLYRAAILFNTSAPSGFEFRIPTGLRKERK
jgi:hypothetical protein